MCGEYATVLAVVVAVVGSPPHVRRVLTIDKDFVVPGGITSACAESTESGFS